MSVLVTGGTGFVGGAIVRALVKQGERVHVLARRTSKTENLTVQGVEIAYGDILDKESIKSALKGCTTLYHAAALYDLWGLDEKTLMETECEWTRNALDAAQAVNIKKVIYTSTAVGIVEQKGKIGTETTKHRGYFLSKYERAKYEAEKIALSYLDKGLPIIIVNPVSVYGPGDLKPSGRAVVDFINGRMPGLFDGSNSFVYLDDVGIGHTLAADKGRVGERYILSGNIVTLNEWGELICQLSGVKMVPIIPAFLVGIFALFGETFSRFTKEPPVLSWETFRIASYGLRVGGSKAEKELGIVYTPLENGLRKTIIWYWEQGLLKQKPDCSWGD
ncbi:MAG: NAD-dependent epimerase/dehydratase family protein [ANME-2 cluster archaeon]|nr:NAD-dependent epimerase/dehydratase family protein [ANME-2 cluster archaeon]MBC2701404.1 NAD-dependent epimerase/dehydratase family protein [ANME-2 cluster archaeon]MBC2707008.1 NAD-dependent epimerase/dehydratase family protein [ANME-2 cluster archaeon]MBC2746070.1 NAD-dependent epimerase/dehydratase family protein [ANME-2 cluster archaeon]MBC2763980.1 NAD-dependent epimerase/dehydratase family protein [ANME-2 cluster archaeon]